jgi:hypothetical protein
MHCRPSRFNVPSPPPALVTPVVDAIVTFFFKYPARVFARGDIVLAPVVPAMVLALVAVLAVLLIVVLHARVRTLPVRDRLVLGTLRALALLLVLGCLLRPGLVIASAVPQRNVFAVLLDDSRSMRIKDVADTSRLARVQHAFDDTASLARKLGNGSPFGVSVSVPTLRRWPVRVISPDRVRVQTLPARSTKCAKTSTDFHSPVSCWFPMALTMAARAMTMRCSPTARVASRCSQLA